MENSIYQSNAIYNCLKQLKLCQLFSHIVIKHVMAVLISVFSYGYKGKTVNFERHSPCHRTTIAHFLNHGKWDDGKLEAILKLAVLQLIYGEPGVPANQYTVLWMIPYLLKQSLRHRPCVP